MSGYHRGLRAGGGKLFETLRLVVVDVDGCLTMGEAQPWNFEVFQFIAELNRQARQGSQGVPAVTLCTGRPEPFVEVLMQAIDAHQPGIYEHGGGLYFPQGYRFVENPAITPEKRAALIRVKAVLRREIVEAGLGYLQPGKEVSLSLFPDDKVALHQLYRATKEVLTTHQAPYLAEESASCVNVIPIGVDKGAGVRWLAQETGIPLAQMGGIGDSAGDLKFLSIVGRSAAPANATDEVKAAVGYVSPCMDGEGVVDILRRWSGR
ncbi:MAG: HAD family hydrolase [Anaerolineae bacterium]